MLDFQTTEIKMFPKKNKKNADKNSKSKSFITASSGSGNFTSKRKSGEYKTNASSSTTNIASLLPDFNDLHSLTSNSSLPTAKIHEPLNNSLADQFNNSLESLHSLPELKSGKSNKNQALKKRKGLSKRANKFFQSPKEKKTSYNISIPLAKASTIMEDDESEQALSVPMLPSFQSTSEYPRQFNTALSTTNLRKNMSDTFSNSSGTALSDSNNMNSPFFSSSSLNKNDINSGNENQSETEAGDKILKSTIDKDFDFNFSKDSLLPRGQALFELKRKKGLPAKKNIIAMSSSDDDTSTQSDSDDDGQLKTYAPKSDDVSSIKSNDSRKFSIKKLFRKRGKSVDSESVKSNTSSNGARSRRNTIFSIRSHESNTGKEKNHKNESNNDDSNNMKNKRILTKNQIDSELEKDDNVLNKIDNIVHQNDDKFHTIGSNLSHYNDAFNHNNFDSLNEKNETSSFDDSGVKNSLNHYHDIGGISKRKREQSNNTDVADYSQSNFSENELNLNEHETGKEKKSDSVETDERELGSIGSQKSEHFLKKVFNLEGLLNGGGLTPNLNLKYNHGTDEENPPLDFQQEIKQEAQVLVNHALGNPLKNKGFRKKKLTRNTANQVPSSTVMDNDNDSSVATTATGQDSFYVPSHAHLAVDPFDDLQDVDNFSIDVPKNMVDRPTKYKAGIQSALFQYHNAQAPSTSNSINSTSYEGSSTLFSNDSESIFPQFDRYRSADSNLDYLDLDTRDSSNVLKMNLGNEIRRHGINGHEDLINEHPDLNLKFEELSQTAQTSFDHMRFPKKFHKRASSVQSFISSHKGNSKYNSSKKKNSNVKFSLPNFETKPDLKDVKTSVEKSELKGYQNLKKRARLDRKLKKETAARITVHIADVLERQRFILTLCKAFMLYGAPTHRLEEYMSMTSKVLEIDGSFIYFPGCMLVSFGDLNTRTSEMKLVRCAQGLDLGKLDEVHDVYKNVVHDRLGTVEGYQILDEIMNRKQKFNAWWCIIFYAVSSLAVAPWAFGGSWIDLPICLGIGSIIGFLQFFVCPKNTLYSSVFEVTSSIIASFIARAIGSINGGNTFCYAALVQSSLALILPGYIILCGSLELQSRNIVAGSVRMFYAFIYSMMLSFGITLGAALYGWIDKDATSTTSCSSNISPWFYFLFVPMFTTGIALTNQASWSQLPMMCIISGCGYVVSYFSSRHFKEVTELNATLGCFIVGLVSNIYTRMLKSINKYFTARGSFMTVSLMLPAIFVQVPSGIASQGSVFSGIQTANNIVHVNNSTITETSKANSLSFGIVMIQVALGISVGLYLSTILVYPFGKKRTGLFTL